MLSQFKNTNKINQSCLSCVYCGKGYKTRSTMDKHLVLCEIMYKSKKSHSQITDVEQVVLPNQKQMYDIILELTLKCNKLEEKVDRFARWVENKKKKINVIEWLNFNFKPTFLFNELADKITFTDVDRDGLHSNGFLTTFSELIKNVFIENGNQLPLFCTEQKTNKMYIYNKSLDNDNALWMQLDNEKMLAFVDKIYMKAVKSLTDWRKELERTNQYNNDNTDIYNKTLAKLLNLNFNHNATRNKIKSIIYNNMKVDVNTMIEFEF